MERPSRVRKGVWTEEEDDILRKCIERHGEGSWYQIPGRAGLNRCRKSCRLRWLNYLKPNIKRGEFQEDEVDLILRLHMLLGNRWSLIAGRLPGRTANDVKNYWNTHLKKKKQEGEVNTSRDPVYHRKHSKTLDAVKVNVIKPRPRAFKKFSRVGCGTLSSPPTTPAQHQPQVVPLEHDISWWEGLWSGSGCTGEATTSKSCWAGSEWGEAAAGGLWCPDTAVDDVWTQDICYGVASTLNQVDVQAED